MHRWMDRLLTGGPWLCLWLLASLMLLSAAGKLVEGSWGLAIGDVVMAAFIVFMFRLMRHALRPAVVVMAPDIPARPAYVTCVVEKFGKVWVLRELYNDRRLVLEEGDLLQIAPVPDKDDEEEG